MGKIPNPLEAPPTEQKAIQLVMKERKELIEEARRQGVRVISMNKFLNYVGYTSTRRLWVPGEPYPYRLKSGSKSLGIKETIGKRQSSGSTSGVYSRGSRTGAPDSRGAIRKPFKTQYEK